MNDVIAKIQETYASKRPKSKQLQEEGCRYLPGGDSRTAVYFKPFPSYMDHGKGSRLYDVDGLEYTDLLNNHTSLVHGHAFPGIVNAVTEQVQKSSAYGAPCEGMIKLAREICNRLPSADTVRFCNSGTEATMGAIGLARYIRRKFKIMKLEGCYHGSHDLAKVSLDPPLELAGDIEKPIPIPTDRGVPPSIMKDCVIAHFNNIPITERLIHENHEELACIILEPIQTNIGVIVPDPDYLKMLRALATKYRIPLIFDEVVTLRLAMGGAQEVYDVVPDLTTLGKVIGGGFPVGGIAGRAEFMDHFSPLNADFIKHSGTFNANPITMTAGYESVRALTADKIAQINTLGDRLRDNFNKAIAEVGIHAQATGIGSLVQVHFTGKPITNWRTAAHEREDLAPLLHVSMLDKGIICEKRCLFNISTAVVEADVDTAGEVFKRSLTEMMPYIEKNAPELIVK